MSAHTHRGHCQMCGRLQAVMHTGLIAKHGYNIAKGYYTGTCGGSERRPLELERDYAETVVESLRRSATAADTYAGELAAGVVNPAHIQTFAQGGKLIAWADGSPVQQARQRRIEIREQANKAEFMRLHAATLRKLIDDRHGQPLQEVTR